ncbi:hypothetical protein H8959_010527 [Pygathrix nigripes]
MKILWTRLREQHVETHIMNLWFKNHDRIISGKPTDSQTLKEVTCRCILCETAEKLVLTEDEMGHPETGDAIARLKEILEHNAIGGKCHRGLTVLAFQKLVEPRKQNNESVQWALTVG